MECIVSECADEASQILSYLELKDCLRFTAASKKCLQGSLPELYRRRQRCTQRFAYAKVSERVVSIGMHRGNSVGPMEEMQARYPDTDWIPLPTVQEQVNQLSKQLPPTHHQYSAVKALADELQKQVNIDAFMRSNSLGFSDLFELFHSTMKVFKLHAQILHHACQGDRLAHSGAYLDRYIGDVLCLTYLIHQNNAGITEGGLTTSAFVADLQQQRLMDSAFYRSWIYMHSSILCNSPRISSEQRARLAIPDFEALPRMIPESCFVAFPVMSSKMRLVTREFGHLGPVYRMRDTVRIQEVDASSFYAYYFGSVDDEEGLLDDDGRVLEWLCCAHEEMRKVRPMSVRLPVVKFSWGRLG